VFEYEINGRITKSTKVYFDNTGGVASGESLQAPSEIKKALLLLK
jgi:hypothetical protein